MLDTGATSSLVSSAFVKRAHLKISPTQHAARQLDKSSIRLIGEARFTVSYGNCELTIDALITDSLDCDILAGVPFCKLNHVDIHLREEAISIAGMRIPYGSKPNPQHHEIRRSDSIILRNDSAW